MKWKKLTTENLEILTKDLIDRSFLKNELTKFFSSINPVCFILGEKGVGKTTFLLNYLKNQKEKVVYFKGEAGIFLTDIFEKEEKNDVVLVIDDYDFISKKEKKIILDRLLPQIKLDNPQYKVLILSRASNHNKLFYEFRKQRFPEVLNFYEEHIIRVGILNENEINQLIELNLGSRLNNVILKKILEISKYNLAEFEFLKDTIKLDSLIEDEATVELLDELELRFEEIWSELIEYGNKIYDKKSKLNNACFAFNLYRNCVFSDFKPELHDKMMKTGLIQLKEGKIELKGSLFGNWIAKEKWLKQRTTRVLLRDLTKSFLTDPRYFSERIQHYYENDMKISSDLLISVLDTYKIDDKFDYLVECLVNLVNINFSDENLEQSIKQIIQRIFNEIYQLINENFNLYISHLEHFIFFPNIIDFNELGTYLMKLYVRLLNGNYIESNVVSFIDISIMYFGQFSPNHGILKQFISNLALKYSIKGRKLSDFYYKIAQYENSTENYQDSIKTLMISVERYQEIKDDFIFYSTLISLSALITRSENKTDLLKTLSPLFDDIKKKSETSNKFVKVNTGIQANLILQIEDKKHIVNELEKILDIARANNYFEIEAACYEKLGDLSQEMGSYDEAEKYYRKTLKTVEHTGYYHGNAVTTKKLGDNLLSQNKIDEAIEIFEQSNFSGTIENSPRERILALTKIATTYSYQGNLETSNRYLDSAFDLATKWDNHDLVYTIRIMRGVNFLRVGDFKEVLKVLESALLMDEIIKLRMEEKAYIEFLRILCLEGTNNKKPEIQKIIEQFKTTYVKEKFTEEFYVILSSYLILNYAPRDFLYDFLEYIVIEFNKRGVFRDFLNFFNTNLLNNIDNFLAEPNVFSKIQKFFSFAKELCLEDKEIVFLSICVEDITKLDLLSKQHIIQDLRNISLSSTIPLIATIAIRKQYYRLLDLIQESEITMSQNKKNIPIELVIEKMKYLANNARSQEAFQIAEKFLEENDINEFDLETKFEFVHDYVYLCLFERSFVKGLEIIEELLSKEYKFLTPNQLGEILFLKGKILLKTSSLEEVETIIEELLKMKLDGKVDWRKKYLQILYFSLIKSFEDAKSLIRKLIFNTEPNDENQPYITIAIATYFTEKKKIEKNEEDLVKYLLEHYQNNRFIRDELFGSLFNLVYYLEEYLSFSELDKHLSAFSEFCKVKEQFGLAKMMYYERILRYSQHKKEYSFLVKEALTLPYEKSDTDIKILLLDIQYLKPKTDLEKLVEKILNILENIKEIYTKGQFYVNEEIWATLIQKVTIVLIYENESKKDFLLKNALKELAASLNDPSWFSLLVSSILSITSEFEEDSFHQLKNSQTIPEVIKSNVVKIVAPYFDPTFIERSLLKDLNQSRKTSNVEVEIQALQNLVDYHFSIYNNEKLQSKAEELEKLALSVDNLELIIESRFALGVTYYKSTNLEKSEMYFDFIVQNPLKQSIPTWIESISYVININIQNNIDLTDFLSKIEKQTLNLDFNFYDVLERITFTSLQLKMFNNLSLIISYIDEISIKDESVHDGINNILLLNSLYEKKTARVVQLIQKKCKDLTDEEKWIFILVELLAYLDISVQNGRKIFFIDLGSRLGRTFRELKRTDQITAELEKIEKSLENEGFLEQNSPIFFIKSFIHTLASFKATGFAKQDDLENRKVIVFVEGLTERLCIPTILNKFYSERLKEWFSKIQIEDSSGKDGILIRLKALESENERTDLRIITLLDNDKKSKLDDLPKTQINIIDQTNKINGSLHILGKRELENYLHPRVLNEYYSSKIFDEYGDAFGKHEKVKDTIQKMHHNSSKRGKSYPATIEEIFKLMSEQDFNSAQHISTDYGEKYSDFDRFVDKILELFYS